MNRNAVIGIVVAAVVVAVGLSFVGGTSSDGPSDGSANESAAPTTTAPVGDVPTSAAPAASTAGPTECAPVGEIPPAEGKPATVNAPTQPTTGKVKVTVLEGGDGPKVTDASYVTVDYLGVACTSGQQFDSSWDRGEPITIAMPSATPTKTAFNVIPGWNQGLEGQAQGSLVQLDIPAELAYGAQGGQGIAPNDPLTFVVKVLEVSDTAPAA